MWSLIIRFSGLKLTSLLLSSPVGAAAAMARRGAVRLTAFFLTLRDVFFAGRAPLRFFATRGSLLKLLERSLGQCCALVKRREWVPSVPAAAPERSASLRVSIRYADCLEQPAKVRVVTQPVDPWIDA